MQNSSLTDHELIQGYLAGDQRFFEVLLRRHKNKIYSTIYLFVKDQALAEDIFQDVFIKIVDTLKKGKYNHEGKFLQWALRIAYNMCVDHFRRSKRRPHVTPTDTFDVMDIVRSPELNMEQMIMQSQTHTRLKALIEMLPPEQREVVILRHFADLSFKEIATLTQVSINTALGRMRYALINIRKLIEEKELVLQ
jgi:RNA polymerase sigma factor (sigma-70 family)